MAPSVDLKHGLGHVNDSRHIDCVDNKAFDESITTLGDSVKDNSDVSDHFPALDSKLFQIKSIKGGGRGVFASTDIGANVKVLECSSPFSSVIFGQFKREVCAYCFKYELGRTMKVKILAKKQLVEGKKKPSSGPYAGLSFCSESCRDLWTAHEDPSGNLSEALETVERALKPSKHKPAKQDYLEPIPVDMDRDLIDQGYLNKRWDLAEQIVDEMASKPLLASPSLNDVEYDTVRLLTVVVVKLSQRRFEGIENVQTVEDMKSTQNILSDKDPIVNFMSLQSNELSQIKQTPQFLDVYLWSYIFLKRVLPKHLQPILTTRLVRSTMGKEAGNTFGIWQLPLMMESECLGSAIYPDGSFFNHGCRPNVAKERIGRKMVFTTVESVQKGSQLCISYGMFGSLPVKERQQNLLNNWNFTCMCGRCGQETKEL